MSAIGGAPNTASFNIDVSIYNSEKEKSILEKDP